jgi:hypothetical protein
MACLAAVLQNKSDVSSVSSATTEDRHSQKVQSPSNRVVVVYTIPRTQHVLPTNTKTMSAISFAPLAARAAAFNGPAIKRGAKSTARSSARASKPTTITAELPKPTKDASIGEVMAFGGVAPELINGRLAMLGFVACAGAEVASGECFNEQFAAAPGPIVAVAAVRYDTLFLQSKT